MVRERSAEKAAAEEKKRKQSKTVLPLLKYFNRSPGNSFQVDAPEEQHKQLNDDQSTIPPEKTTEEPTETVDPSAAAPGVTPGAAPAAAEKTAATVETGSSSLSSKPTTAVVIATASSRRINLCRTTLGLEVTSIPSSYEEDRKKSAAAASSEGEGGAAAEDEGATPTGAVQAAGTLEESGGQEKRKKFKKAEEPHFSDEELLLLLGEGSHRLVNLDSSRSSSISPRRGRSSRAALAGQLMETKMYALRMALGKASSVAQQLWSEQQQQPGSHSSKSTSSTETKSVTSSDGDDSGSGEEKQQLPAGCVVIGADTIIELDGKILEKAESQEEAKQMLLSLSGKTHSVHTAVSIFTQKEGSRKPAAAAVSTTSVSLVDFTEEDVDAYVATGQYEGKSGSYGILELAGQFIKGIDGCVFTVMGLPVQWVSAILASLYYSNRIA